MSKLRLWTNNEELHAALARVVNNGDDNNMIIHIEGVPFKIAQLDTHRPCVNVESTTIFETYQMPTGELELELQAAFAPYPEDEIRMGDTVYFVDNGTDTAYTVIGQSTHGHSRTGEPMMIVERQEKASKISRIRKSLLTKTKPLYPKNGEIWEIQWNSRVTVGYFMDDQWHAVKDGNSPFVRTSHIKPIRKLGEVE